MRVTARMGARGTDVSLRSAYTLRGYSSTGVFVSSIGGVEIDPDPLFLGPVSATATIPSGVVRWALEITCQPGGGPCPAEREHIADVEVFCGGLPSALEPRCCPPDSTLAAKVDQLVEAVTLIQRQHVPFAYVPGAVHSALSGQGEVAVSGILAISVQLTTISPIVGELDSHPDALFEAGRISVGTADGFEASKPITTSPWFQYVSGAATRIGYDFPVGCVATIRTWLKEP